MRIEDEMVSRFNHTVEKEDSLMLSEELDFFFDNIMSTVVDYFKDEVTVK